MKSKRTAWGQSAIFCYILILWCVMGVAGSGWAGDLKEVKEKGVVRHLGVPYANFVTGSGDGLDVEMVKLFAEHLGVRYEYVQTTWDDVIPDLSGKKVRPVGDEVEIIGEVPIKGDIAANGLTILPWREKVIDYSEPTFPNQVWLIARADAPLNPIQPSGDVEKDIAAVKAQLKGSEIMGMADTCLDPVLYGLDKTGAVCTSFKGSVNELVPAVINGEATGTIQDVADALLAVEKWPGKVKIIGPVSAMQNMGYGFSKNSPELRAAFNEFFKQCVHDGTYNRIVEKYYPAIFNYYPEFFEVK
ncbi:transporter substrate-binding domain-containing protein [Desulfoferrobacter suflitae]|uniref:transporter substrate-binding domain-containing protein n=1 Tax=Desulfoferrobacter suflitae TaxID=2865782 RepID=UPI00216451BC|nr:transporter substrate-binding domain-containing protein [Desulfoferrobacter suflitae]MCK8601949.1 transporter substrate-binding domain-containing protein [Desulfoferrobacter suflitae]